MVGKIPYHMTTTKSLLPDADLINKAYLKANALRHPFRMRVCQFLDSKEESITVTDLYIKFRVEQSVMSQQLAILRRAGYLLGTREGKQIAYSLTEEFYRVNEKFGRL